MFQCVVGSSPRWLSSCVDADQFVAPPGTGWGDELVDSRCRSDRVLRAGLSQGFSVFAVRGSEIGVDHLGVVGDFGGGA